MSMELATPGRQELEAMSLAERVALEDAFGQAHDLIRQLNDDEVVRLVDAGASLAALAAAAGRDKSWAQRRVTALGIQTLGQREVSPIPPLPQNGDGPAEDAEVVDGEVVDEPARPVQHMPDVMDANADLNLRTQALIWFEQGRAVKTLLDQEAVIEPRSRGDKTAIKREAAEMGRVARRLKGAF